MKVSGGMIMMCRKLDPQLASEFVFLFDFFQWAFSRSVIHSQQPEPETLQSQSSLAQTSVRSLTRSVTRTPSSANGWPVLRHASQRLPAQDATCAMLLGWTPRRAGSSLSRRGVGWMSRCAMGSGSVTSARLSVIFTSVAVRVISATVTSPFKVVWSV